jgi:hypothetical protein
MERLGSGQPKQSLDEYDTKEHYGSQPPPPWLTAQDGPVMSMPLSIRPPAPDARRRGALDSKKSSTDALPNRSLGRKIL